MKIKEREKKKEKVVGSKQNNHLPQAPHHHGGDGEMIQSPSLEVLPVLIDQPYIIQDMQAILFIQSSLSVEGNIILIFYWSIIQIKHTDLSIPFIKGTENKVEGLLP